MTHKIIRQAAGLAALATAYLLVTTLGGPPALAQATKDIDLVPNRQISGVNLILEAGRPTVRVGEEVSFCFTASNSGYATLWDVGSSGRVARIFPYAAGEPPARVDAGQRYCAGTREARYSFRVAGPGGFEDVYLVWSRTPESHPTSVNFPTAGHLTRDIQAQERSGGADWATQKVTLEILDTATPPGPSIRIPPESRLHSSSGGQVFVLAMGANVGGLTKANQDAKLFADAITQLFQVPAANMRMVSNARRRDFEDGMRWLQAAGPDDQVFIFFSGHGTTVTDDDGDEADGLDEAFVMYDAESMALPDSNSFVHDDTFARWVRDLKTNRVVTVIDACHSGGLAKSLAFTATNARVKFLTKGMLGLSPPATPPLSAKARSDLPGGVDGASAGPSPEIKGVVLAAARENQFALESPEGGVFVNALVRAMATANSGHNLRDIFEVAARSVENVTRRQQTPMLVGSGGVAAEISLR